MISRGEIKRISSYLKETEQAVSLRQLDRHGAEMHLAELHRIIERLMRAALFGSLGVRVKEIVSSLEYEARTCRDGLENRLELLRHCA